MHDILTDILHVHGLDADPAVFLASADGCALLALLCNAAAKQDARFYAFKAALVQAACAAAPRDRWWCDTHVYARAWGVPVLDRLNIWWQARCGGYLFGAEPMPIYFIETDVLLDGAPLQIAFHFLPGNDLPALPDAPGPNGRGWRGQRVQARAADVARAWSAPQIVTVAHESGCLHTGVLGL